MEKRWDFYLTDENEETYLYFNLTSYSFGPELSELFPNRSELCGPISLFSRTKGCFRKTRWNEIYI